MDSEAVRHWFEFEINQAKENMKDKDNGMFNSVEVGIEKQVELNKAHIRFCETFLRLLDK